MTSTRDHFHGGQGRRVLLLHSGFCIWAEWRRTIELLRDDHEVLAPTLPGSLGGPRLELTDRSMLTELADHAESLLDEYGWDEPVDVVGSSYGGLVAMELMNRGRASRVLALAPPWTGGLGMGFYGALFSPMVPLRLARPVFGQTTRSGLLNGLFLHTSTQAPVIDQTDMALLLRSMTSFPLVRTGMAGGPGMPAVPADLGSAVTFAWGSADAYVPRWMRARWQRALPNASVVQLKGFPHQPHLRDPQRIAELIRLR